MYKTAEVENLNWFKNCVSAEMKASCSVFFGGCMSSARSLKSSGVLEIEQ